MNKMENINLQEKESSHSSIRNDFSPNPPLTIKKRLADKFSSIKKLFRLPGNNSSNSIDTEDTKINSNTETQGQSDTTCKRRFINKVISLIEVEKSYKIFFILLCIGIGLICLSFFFLPLMIVSPSKFMMLFGFGSLLLLTSFLFMYGTKAYFEILLSKSRFWISIIFTISIFLGIILSFGGYWIFSLICAIFQMIGLVIFILSFLPGGRNGINCIKNAFTSPFVGMWLRFRGNNMLPS